MSKSTQAIHLIVGPLLFILCCLLLPKSIFSTLAMRSAIGTVAWISYWWVTGPVDLAVTAFLPIIINAVLPMTDMSAVIANYSSETILLLLGASILTISWAETGFDRRLAMRTLSFIGNGVRNQLIFWFLLSAILSSILPNSVVCATIIPIAVAMLSYVGINDIEKSNIGSKLLLTIVFAIGVGGLATPLGGSMNLITVDYIQQLTGQEYIYANWVRIFSPIMVVLIIFNLLFIIRNIKKDDNLGKSRSYFIMEYKKLPKMSKEETWAFILFIIAVLLSFTRQFYKEFIPTLKPAYTFIICAMFTFFITRKDGSRVMLWKNVKNKVIWQLLFLFGGGLAAGTLISNTGAALAIGESISYLNMENSIWLIAIVILIPMLLSNFTSNTGTAAIMMPIVISIAQGLGRNPLPYIYIATIGVNLAYMFPTSIRSIPVGYGLSPKYLLNEGWKISLIVWFLMVLCCLILLNLNYFVIE